MIIVDGKESADAKILRLERDNADLKLQLERGVKLREELFEALGQFHQSFCGVRIDLNFNSVCETLEEAYTNALKDGAI